MALESDVQEPNRPRLDRGVAWAVGLLLASFPLMLLFLVLASWTADALGVDPGSGSPGDRALNATYVVAVVAVLLASITTGLSAWRRRGQRVGAVVACAATITAVLFVLLPWLLSG